MIQEKDKDTSNPTIRRQQHYAQLYWGKGNHFLIIGLQLMLMHVVMWM